MAQDFERKIPFNSSGDIAIGTTARTVMTSNSDDTIIGIRLTNITNATIKANVYVTSTASGGSADSFLVYQNSYCSRWSIRGHRWWIKNSPTIGRCFTNTK